MSAKLNLRPAINSELAVPVAEVPPAANETPLERAQRLYGRPFGQENWPAGEKARYWTTERLTELRLANERLREKRIHDE